MLNALGPGIGATTVDAVAPDSRAASNVGICAALGLVTSNLTALAIGGYVAARLPRATGNTDGMLHGVVAAILDARHGNRDMLASQSRRIAGRS